LKTHKNLHNEGYTTYHEDGSKSTTFKNITNDGYTTYHDDGSTSHTYKNSFSNGYSTYNSSGSSVLTIFIGAILCIGSFVQTLLDCGKVVIFPLLLSFLILPVATLILRRTYIKPMWTIFGYGYTIIKLFHIFRTSDFTIPIMNIVVWIFLVILIGWISVGLFCFFDDSSDLIDFIITILLPTTIVLYVVSYGQDVAGTLKNVFLGSFVLQIILMIVSQIYYIKFVSNLRKNRRKH